MSDFAITLSPDRQSAEIVNPPDDENEVLLGLIAANIRDMMNQFKSEHRRKAFYQALASDNPTLTEAGVNKTLKLLARKLAPDKALCRFTEKGFEANGTKSDLAVADDESVGQAFQRAVARDQALKSAEENDGVPKIGLAAERPTDNWQPFARGMAAQIIVDALRAVHPRGVIRH